MAEVDVKALIEEQQGVFAEFTKSLEGANANSALALEKQEKLNDRLDQIETAMQRVQTAAEKSAANDQAEERKSFDDYFRKGLIGERVADRQNVLIGTKALTVGNDTTAGYLAQPEFIAELIKNIVEFSPVRSFCRVRTTGAKAIQIPKRTGTFSAQWTTETGTRSETTGYTAGLEEIAAHEMYALVDISNAMLEDSEFDLEAEMRMEFGEQFGVAEGTAVVNGNGVGKPEGFMTNTSISAVAGGGASSLTADGLISLMVEPKWPYYQNGVFVFNRATLGAIRKLKDTQNQYLWQPGLQDGVPGTLLGRPYFVCVDMPDIAANAYPIAFGDFRAGYTIVDRITLEILRDPYTQATSGAVRYIARKRVGGQVVKAEAIKKLKVATSV